MKQSEIILVFHNKDTKKSYRTLVMEGLFIHKIKKPK